MPKPRRRPTLLLMSVARRAATAVEAAVTEAAVIPRLPPPVSSPRTKKRTWSQVATIGSTLLVGGAVGFLGAKFGGELLVRLDGPKWLSLVSFCFLPFAWLAVVAFHEFGHVVGGWIAGGKLVLYAVGPLMWKRTPAGLRFSWNTKVNLAGGLAACLPLDADRISPARLAIMIAGGPVFSLLQAVVALGLTIWLTPRVDGLVLGFAQHAALMLTVVAALIFLVTALPGAAGGFKTDGRRFFDLLRTDARSNQEQAMIALTINGLAGVRPADYAPRLVDQALALRDGSLFDLYAHLTIFLHAIDLGQPARGQALLDYVVAGEAQLAPFARDTARCEYAWLLATQTADVAAARAWLESAGKLDFDPATRLRAEAAVLLAEGRKSEAAAKVREGLHALEHRSLNPVKSRLAEELLEDLLRRAEAA